MQALLHKLFDYETLSEEEARVLLTAIIEGRANDAQIVAAITALKMRPVTATELHGFRTALLDQALLPRLSTREAIDVCGTGGDGKNTFNISTLAAIVIAAAGYPVIKHGNYGVSSLVGSSSILERLGYQFTTDEAQLNRQLEQANACFLHAPLFHPALKRVASIRKALGVRTFFNFLGPLVNPVQPKYQLSGVYSLELVRIYQTLLQGERTSFTIVHSLEGYDEVSLTSPFKIATTDDERILYPEELAAQEVRPDDLKGGDTLQEAEQIFLKILQNEGTAAQTSVVLVNAALGIQCFSPDRSFEQCYREAETALSTQKAYRQFMHIIAISKH